MIKEYFQQRLCKHCNRNFTSDGIQFIREEPGMMVVRVGCSSCGQPLGIALVGMSGGNSVPLTAGNRRSSNLGPAPADDIPYPADWTKNDIQRLARSSRISYDDVLDAHKFFSNLGADWQKHLPKKTRRNSKPVSA